jgi:hypothetical protein
MDVVLVTVVDEERLGGLLKDYYGAARVGWSNLQRAEPELPRRTALTTSTRQLSRRHQSR